MVELYDGTSALPWWRRHETCKPTSKTPNQTIIPKPKSKQTAKSKEPDSENKHNQKPEFQLKIKTTATTILCNNHGVCVQ